MRVDTIREYCLAKPGVTEGFPFTEATLVFKVMGKMFLLAGIDNIPLSINIKSDPEKAMELREKYEEVQPGYHMNKKMWNTVILNGRIPSKEVLAWIDESYALVVQSLPKTVREELERGTVAVKADVSRERRKK